MTTNFQEECIGYFKYTGENIAHGYFGAKSAAEVLSGFNEVLYYFLSEIDPEFKNIRLDIPIGIEKGSWSIVIPEIIDKILTFKGVGSTALAVYTINTARVAAKDGSSNTGMAKDIKAILKAALKTAQWVIRIRKHIGSFKNTPYEIISEETLEMVKIKNERGGILPVPKQYLVAYEKCPCKTFSQAVGPVEKKITLEIGVIENGREEKVEITAKEKELFYMLEENVILPELIDGQNVELAGTITKVNEKTNSIGLEYKGYVITCKPIKSNSIASFKQNIFSLETEHLFQEVRIKGTINRAIKEDGSVEKKPTLYFTEIILINKSKKEQLSLNL